MDRYFTHLCLFSTQTRHLFHFLFFFIFVNLESCALIFKNSRTIKDIGLVLSLDPELLDSRYYSHFRYKLDLLRLRQKIIVEFTMLFLSWNNVSFYPTKYVKFSLALKATVFEGSLSINSDRVIETVCSLYIDTS